MGCSDAPCESRGCGHDYGHNGLHTWQEKDPFLKAKVGMEYHSHNLGEFGQFIKLQYALNILDDLQKALEGK